MPILDLLRAGPEIVPVIEELDCGNVSFLDIAEHFSKHPHFALLDSRLLTTHNDHYSFLAIRPFLIAGSKNGRAWLQTWNEREETDQDILHLLDEIARRWRFAPETHAMGAPFTGGGIGFFSYEFGRQLETISAQPVRENGIADCCFYFYNFVLIFCHRSEKLYLSTFDPNVVGAITREEVLSELSTVGAGCYEQRLAEETITPVARSVRADFTPDAYLAAVNRIKDYIAAGDIYQANLTQRFRVDARDLDYWTLYKRLMRTNPTPFAAYLLFDGVTVISASPERFLQVRGRHVETRPIKGTIRRGDSEMEDEALRRWLLASEKNRAELAMIVDLMRNDLGRVCRAGSIAVEQFPQLETYASLHHLVATVTGELQPGKTVIDVVRAAFPGGSITGAPKIRAMQIIEELEPVPRGLYTGSIAYLGFNGNADLNIVIRTIVIQNGTASLQTGGGIVADSVDTDEYEESLVKIRPLLTALCGTDRPLH